MHEVHYFSHCHFMDTTACALGHRGIVGDITVRITAAAYLLQLCVSREYVQTFVCDYSRTVCAIMRPHCIKHDTMVDIQ